MQLSDWGDLWRDGQIGFHQSDVTDALRKFADVAWTDPPARVLVPLCGKSLDMVFLAERAQAVVGVEYVQQAVEEFFAERDVAPDIDPGPPVKYSAGPYTVFAGDFFGIGSADLGTIDAVFDRAALVAIKPETRPRYVDHLRTLTEAGARMLLITFDYHQPDMNGPPFAVSDGDVERLFCDGFTIDHLQTRDVLNDVFRQRGLGHMTESTFVLTRPA